MTSVDHNVSVKIAQKLLKIGISPPHMKNPNETPGWFCINFRRNDNLTLIVLLVLVLKWNPINKHLYMHWHQHQHHHCIHLAITTPTAMQHIFMHGTMHYALGTKQLNPYQLNTHCRGRGVRGGIFEAEKIWTSGYMKLTGWGGASNNFSPKMISRTAYGR